MTAGFKRVKGFADMFGEESSLFTFLETTARTTFANYDYEELRAPILEATELFARSIGQVTDVVQKEMFTFADRKGRSLTLRPEATAGVIRAYVESGRDRDGTIARFFSVGPMFRFERPQKGRMRQFHQINCECLGGDSPYIDAELICMLMDFLTRAGIGGLKINLNSLGCSECRPAYLAALREYLNAFAESELCADCRIRRETNPLRVLDCKEASCRALIAGAPKLIDYNCDACRTHFEKVRELLKLENIDYVVNHTLVRGLDYYCRTTFEVVSDEIGAQTAVAGGGRYDGLVSQIGGADAPGVGFACGMERLALILEKTRRERPRPVFYLVCPDAENMDLAFQIAIKLRDANIAGEMNYRPASFKRLMRDAARSGARYALILGGDEAAAGRVAAKNMDDGSQVDIRLDELVEKLK